MRFLKLIFIVVLFVILAVTALPASAQARPTPTGLPGDWNSLTGYCRDGMRITITGDLASGNTSDILILSVGVPATTGVIASFSTPGPVSTSVNVFFQDMQSVGRAIQLTLDRTQNGSSTTGGAGADASGTVEDCLISQGGQYGRINQEIMAPVAIFCRSGNIEVWAIDTQDRGHLAVRAYKADIDRVGVPPVNTLLASGFGVGLYRLNSGEFQVNSRWRQSPSVFASSPASGSTTTITVPVTTTITTTIPTVPLTTTGGLIHTVQAGENLFRIALRYNTTLEAIAAINGITNVRLIHVGDQLLIPSSGGSTTPTTSTSTTTTTTSTIQVTTTPAPVTQPPADSAIGLAYTYIWSGCNP